VVKISTAGNIISSFDMSYESDVRIDSEQNEIFKIISKVVFYIFIFILLAIIAYRRIKAYEIGFSIALILGSIVAVCSGIEIYMNLNTDLGWESLIPLLIGPLMFGAAIVLVWGPSETITREVWKSKRSEEHTSDSSHVKISYAVFCLKKKRKKETKLIE